MDVRLALTSLYNEYAIESTRNAFDGRLSTNVGNTRGGASDSSGTPSSATSPLVSLVKWKLGLQGFLKENSSIERKSDLEMHLDEALWPTIAEEDFDILGSLQVNGLRDVAMVVYHFNSNEAVAGATPGAQVLATHIPVPAMAHLSLASRKLKVKKLAMAMHWWLNILHLLGLFIQLWARKEQKKMD
ncbi:hypothetical protein MRB53_023865 [Persea americana]|uniref:Uncharacterized protein n=1 Tax=Persea americana TaxID=3435 RepID=A0ACC2LBS3_PERAE|nr:hypothetical protein MRB53_023865 [Persea americana]